MATRKGSKWTVEVEGIKVSGSVDPRDDYELTELMVTRISPTATQAEKSAATIASYRLILGDEYGRVKDELRAKHGGTLTNTDMIAFMNALTNKVAELKNSQA